jgi:hypothetical protein
MDTVSIEDIVRAAQAAGAPAMVRVPYNRPEYIRRALDSGADGVQVPLVNSPADAASAVKPANFPPVGERGVAFLTRAAQYGMEKERSTYFERANAAKVVSLHIETVEAVRNLDAILDAGGPTCTLSVRVISRSPWATVMTRTTRRSGRPSSALSARLRRAASSRVLCAPTSTERSGRLSGRRITSSARSPHS